MFLVLWLLISNSRVLDCTFFADTFQDASVWSWHSIQNYKINYYNSIPDILVPLKIEIFLLVKISKKLKLQNHF